MTTTKPTEKKPIAKRPGVAKIAAEVVPKTAPKSAAKSAPKPAPKPAAKPAVMPTAVARPKNTEKKPVKAPVAVKPTPSQPLAAAAPVAATKKLVTERVKKSELAVAAKAAKPVKEKKVSIKKPKLVRDSFTFPETDYVKFSLLKQRALKSGLDVKKSELLRAGLSVLSALNDAALLQVLNGIDKLKPGRPSK